MSALSTALLAALAASVAHAAGYCDAAVMSAFSGVLGGDCMPVNDTCPMGCGMLLQGTLAACQGENFTFGGTGDARPFEAGAVAAGLSPFLRGPCVEAAVNAVFNSTMYLPTCRDGVLLFLSASGSLCGGNSSSTSMCSEECERVVDAAFDHCESTEVLDFNGTELSAAQAVGTIRMGGLLSRECTAFLDTRTFIGEANGSGRPGVLPMPVPPMLVTNTECDEAFRSAGPVIYGGGCLTFGGDTCPMACQGALESLLTTCAGANFTLFPSGHVVQFPLATAVGIAQQLPRACQELPIEILLNSDTYAESTCEDALQLLVGAVGIPACQDDGESMCPEICQRVIGAPFDRCQGTDKLDINGTQRAAGELVAMAGARLSDRCSEVLGARNFGMTGAGTTTAVEVHNTMKPNPSTTGPMMMGTRTTSAEDGDMVSSSAIGAAVLASVVPAAMAALVFGR